VGHGGLAGEVLNSIVKTKKMGEDRDLYNLSIYALCFRRRGHATEKIDVL
jgi:hypothetical protein